MLFIYQFQITPINDASWAITMKEKKGNESKATVKKPARLAECQKGHVDLEIDRELLKMDLEEKQERAAKNKEMQQQQQKNKLQKHHTDVLFISEMKRAGIQ